MKPLLFLLFLIFSVSLVSGIGISPASHQINFEPGGEETVSFRIVNKEGSEMYAGIKLSGDFSEYASVSDEQLVVEGHSTERVSVNIDFPEEADKPGKHKLNLRVLEESPTGGGMTAQAGVIGVIVIHVPYPGQYAEFTSFNVAGGSGGVNEGERASASFGLINKGKEALLDTNATVRVRDLQGAVVDVVSFDNIDMNPSGRFEKEFFLDTGELPPSDYNATIKYDYGPETISRSLMFRVGNFDVELANHSGVVYKKGIVPFEFDVRNLWKGEMAVEASLDVPGAPAAESSRVEFDDFATKRMKVFLDTANLGLGVHNGTLTLSVEKLEEAGEEASIEKQIPVSFEVSDEPDPVEESPEGLAGVPMVYVVLVALVVLLGVNGFFLARTLKHRRK